MVTISLSLSLSLSTHTHTHVYATMHPIQANSKNKVIFFYIDALRHIITDICSLYSLAYGCGHISTIPFSYWQHVPGTVIQYSLPGKVTITAKEKKKKKKPTSCMMHCRKALKFSINYFIRVRFRGLHHTNILRDVDSVFPPGDFHFIFLCQG